MPHIEEIIEQARAKYSRCDTYVDAGISSFIEDDYLGTQAFKTYFQRPHFYRFEWQRTQGSQGVGPVFGIWSDGEHTRLKLKKVHSSPSLAVAVAGAHGAGGAVEISAALLMSEIRLHTKSTLDLDNFELLPDDQIGGTTCYVLSGQDRKPKDCRVWISKSDWTIKRVEIDFYTTAEESERRAIGINERERLLSEKLGRIAEIAPPKQHKDHHTIWRYDYTQSDFDVQLQQDILNYPWVDGPENA